MVYVQYGCGFSAPEGWLNFDASPTLFIERLPAIGGAISKAFSGNAQRFPANVRFGDIRRGPLVPPGAAAGVYASHVLEHLSLAEFRRALAHSFAMLAPGGRFRLVVPDLRERARRYVAGEASALDFIRMTDMGREAPRSSALRALRAMLGHSTHLWMWDEASLAIELAEAGFIAARRCDFGDSGDAMFDLVEDATRFFDPNLRLRECAMEAQKPGA